ncbi:MAG: hypothetical protein IJT96_01065 [Lachnospiraceae bacterium]|nr:hypothetical protein [Lachnospiraceae bacterium]
MSETRKREVKVVIEASAYEAKAMADHYYRDRKYEVVSRSKPRPCKGNKVRICLSLIKKTQLGYRHDGGWDKRKDRRKHRLNIEELMRQPY